MSEKIGYIKSFRKLLDWEWFRDVNTCHFFIYCLHRANYDTQRFMGMEIPRGSFISSLSNMSKETGLSLQNIRTSIQKLENTNNITSLSTNKFTIINVVNYELYQDEIFETNKRLTNGKGLHKKNDKKINTQTNKQTTNYNTDEYNVSENYINETNTQTNKQLTNDQQTTNNNKRNKEIKNINIINNINNKEQQYFTDEKLNSTFNEYLNLRKKMKMQNTERAIQLLINKLEPYDDGRKILMLENAIVNNWKSVYPLKENTIDTLKRLIENEKRRNNENDNGTTTNFSELPF